jgi:hypothetical protein
MIGLQEKVKARVEEFHKPLPQPWPLSLFELAATASAAAIFVGKTRCY